ncbi:hypothetical protein EIP91_007310 [Steccherinum ochraceum]|uniref:AB hydrolase-1 domain-containing protein n=1 Tax=Steccherinum ochraceum TaxID=92696 RepID=A0A4R0RA15_9APHY|nr:hypothetical protein EIP91_007310 [Steccherinum ochraceum]
MSLSVEELVLTGSPQYGGLKFPFKRYTSSQSTSSPSGISLIFMHCIGTHKETWEPTIEVLLDLQRKAGRQVNIAEVWCLDAPNHGHAAALNDEALTNLSSPIDTATCAHGIQLLVASGRIRGDKIVALGHSAGATITIFSTAGCPLDRLPLAAMILLEPPMMTRPLLKKMLKGAAKGEANAMQIAMTAVKTRRDTWPSREAASQWLSKRFPWSTWDERARKRFVDHGLCQLPTSSYPDKHDGVTLACAREQEAAGYVDFEGMLAGLDRLSEICPVLPVHCIFAEREDLVSAETRAGIVDVKAGRRMASISTIEGAGHLAPQENPDGTAGAIWKVLESVASKRESKL